jgi:signal transduction histidine kinase
MPSSSSGAPDPARALRSLAACTARQSALGAAVERTREIFDATLCRLWAAGESGSLQPAVTSPQAAPDPAAPAATLMRALASETIVRLEPDGVAAPLMSGGSTIGVLELHGGHSDDPDWRDHVETAAEVLGPALAAHRLRARLADRERERSELFDLVLEAADRDRRRLAHRLHDGPQQLMTALRLMADVARHAVQSGDGDRARHAIGELERRASEAGDDLRRMTRRLHPVVMEQQGLVHALGSLAETVVEEYATPAEWVHPAERWQGDPARDRVVYQVAREAALATVRAGTPPVAIRLAPERRELAVEGGAMRDGDEDASDVRLAERIIRERAARLGADLDVEWRAGRPMRVRLALPATDATAA